MENLFVTHYCGQTQRTQKRQMVVDHHQVVSIYLKKQKKPKPLTILLITIIQELIFVLVKFHNQLPLLSNNSYLEGK